MKKQFTSMNICKDFRHVYSAPYCALQYIYSHNNNPQFYNCGVYGWNCDLYIDYSSDTIITTGYRNMRGKDIPYAIIERYNKRASAIRKKYSMRYTPKMLQELDDNISDFINELNETL